MGSLTARSGFALALGLLLFAGSAAAVTIDNFGDGTLNFVGPGGTLNDQNLQSSGIILGGDREETITNASAAGGILAGVSAGDWSYGALNAMGSALIIWDGASGSFPGLDATGLGGIDFTEANAHNGIHFRISTNDIAAPLVLTVYTDATNFSTLTVNTPGGIPSGPAFDLAVEFASFSIGGGTGADFANVGAFTLFVDGLSEPQLDLTLDVIETGVVATVPEPNTAALFAFGLVSLAALRRTRTV
jgi:hypothetical protein